VSVGNQILEVLYCPGHTARPRAFFLAQPNRFRRDVLFKGSIGRTDFPRGDYPR